MTRDDAVKRIQRTLAFRTDLTTEIIDSLQDAQVRLEQGAELPWFLHTEMATINTVKGEERVPKPNDFLRELDEGSLYYFDGAAVDDDDKYTPLTKEELEYLRNNLAGSGVPKAYSLDGKYFRIFPTPDAIYSIKMIYFKKDVVLTSNVENLWLEHIPFLLIGKAGGMIAPGLRDKEAVDAFQLWEVQDLDALQRANTAYFASSRRFVMGGPD